MKVVVLLTSKDLYIWIRIYVHCVHVVRPKEKDKMEVEDEEERSRKTNENRKPCAALVCARVYCNISFHAQATALALAQWQTNTSKHPCSYVTNENYSTWNLSVKFQSFPCPSFPYVDRTRESCFAEKRNSICNILKLGKFISDSVINHIQQHDKPRSSTF